MAILGGFRQSDSAVLMFMSYQAWATVLVAAVLRLPRVT